MRQFKGIRMFALVAMALFAVASSAGNVSAQAGGTVTVAKGKAIKIGWAGDLSKQLIKPSEGVQYGAQIAVNRINAAGGINGFQVALESQDDQCTGDIAATVAQKFASEPDIVAIVGHICSGATVPASDVYEKARIPIVSASATANKVTNRGLDIVNRVAFNDNNQALGDSAFLINVLKVKNIVVLDDNQAYGQGLAKALAADFTALGGTVLDAESIDKDAKDYSPILSKLLANPPDLIFFGGYYGPGALLTQQMHSLGMTKTIFFSDDGVKTNDYLQLAGKDAETQYASAIGSADLDKATQDAVTAFQAEFEKTFSVKYGDYDPYQPAGFDAAQVILNAIKSVAKVDGDNLTIDRESLIKAIRATKAYQGLTGTLTCDSKGECGAGVVSIFQVKGGAWVTAKTYNADDLAKLAAAMPGAAAAATMAATMPASAVTMAATMAATP